MLARATLVVAHPDDEVLWFASVLQQVGRVVIAFRDYAAEPELGRRRAAAMAELPYRDLVALALPESGSFDRADWRDPRPDDQGLALEGPGETEARYRANFLSLCAALRPLLDGCPDVLTHNPWGEYGHEDHVQVHRAVALLRAELGFRQWTDLYCSDLSARLAGRFASADVPVRRAVDGAAATRIAEIYRRHGCWTWIAGWRWPAEESLLPNPVPAAGNADATPLPLQMVPASGGGPRRALRG